MLLLYNYICFLESRSAVTIFNKIGETDLVEIKTLLAELNSKYIPSSSLLPTYEINTGQQNCSSYLYLKSVIVLYFFCVCRYLYLNSPMILNIVLIYDVDITFPTKNQPNPM